MDTAVIIAATVIVGTYCVAAVGLALVLAWLNQRHP